MINKKVLVIAEAGVNHNGSLDVALQMVDAAVEAGVDVVKFQTFIAKNLVTKDAKMAGYQKTNTGVEQSQFQMLKKLELSFDDHHIIIKRCKEKNIRFLSTAFDFESLDFLISLNLGLWKIPSGEITNLPYLEKIGKLGQQVIVSTGMAELREVEEAIEALLRVGLKKELITVLHCNTEYPTPMEDVNLNAMKAMGEKFGISFGYSDHTMGIEIPTAAVALGATVIEKHFTLDRNLPGPDHKASLEPHELKAMMSSIRNVEVALGSFEKKVTPSEQKNRLVGRKSIVALTDISVGDTLSEQNLTTARPGSGLSPMKWHQILNQKSKRAYKAGDIIEEILT